MKKILSFVLFLLAMGSINLGQTINVMTYNLRFDNPDDGENRWDNRKDLVLSQINYYSPDVFGIQEGLEHQVVWLDENLKSYSYVGVGRDDGKTGGEFSAVFYNSEKFDLLDSGTFWLSETPGKPSKGWDAACMRVCSYALLQYKDSGTKFWAFNTHFDHLGEVAREKSPEVIFKKMDSLNVKDYPVFLTGDFNSTPDTKQIQEMEERLNNSREICKSEPFGPEGTFCSFDVCGSVEGRIDHIFTSKNEIVVNKYAVIANIWNNHYPSDHYPVLINASFK